MSVSLDDLAALLRPPRTLDVAAELPRTFPTGNRTVAASVTDIHNFEPPNGQDLYEVVGAVAQVTTSIDVNDDLSFTYRDEVTAQSFPLSRALLTSLTSSLLGFPHQSPVAAVYAIRPQKPLQLFRTPANEPWFRFQSQLITTATVGNRVWNARIIYQRVKRVAQ